MCLATGHVCGILIDTKSLHLPITTTYGTARRNREEEEEEEEEEEWQF